MLFKGDDAAAVRALGAGIDLNRRAAVRAVDGLHGFVLFRLRAGRADKIPLVDHELLLVLAAGNKIAGLVIERVIDDARVQTGDEHVVAALLAPAAEVYRQHGNTLDIIGLALLLLALKLVVHLREECVGAVRADRRNVLLLPAVLHLYIQIRQLRGQLSLVEVFVELLILSHGLQLAVCSRRPAGAAGRSLLLLCA